MTGNPADELNGPTGGDMPEIEAESFRILRSLVDLSGMPPLSRAVTERVIHASADLGYATDLVCDESALAAGCEVLAGGAPVVADVAMVAAGITGRPAVCKIGEALTARLARTAGITRSAAAIRLAFSETGPGAVWVVGCAPTALEEIIARQVQPALVIGLPVGFVGAAEAKEALRACGLPALSNVSPKGGSAVAAAAINALLRTLGDSGRDAGAGREPGAERDAGGERNTGGRPGTAEGPTAGNGAGR